MPYRTVWRNEDTQPGDFWHEESGKYYSLEAARRALVETIDVMVYNTNDAYDPLHVAVAKACALRAEPGDIVTLHKPPGSIAYQTVYSRIIEIPEG